MIPTGRINTERERWEKGERRKGWRREKERGRRREGGRWGR